MTNHDHLNQLEAESIFILREIAAEARRPVLFFSGGKDSTLLLHLARKAFWPGRLPFPLLHVDTGHNYEEVIAFRDETATALQAKLIVRHVEDSIKAGRVRLPPPTDHEPTPSRNGAQSVTLRDALAEFEFDAAIGGARRDEERARAKERIYSVRGLDGAWNPKAQRPELWDLYNPVLAKGEHLRVFPISNWTELDVWAYIAREHIALPALYYAHPRAVVRRGRQLMPVTAYTPPRPGDLIETLSVRFRTVGDITCTAPVLSTAATADEILAETLVTTTTERGATRLDDAANDAAMELRKREGYF
jgi:sulfate adenylyltransferase subunit 2